MDSAAPRSGSVPPQEGGSLEEQASTASERADARARPPVNSDPAFVEAVAEVDVEDAFLRAVDEGRKRIARRFFPLATTGVVGGIDVGTGVLALLLVENATHSKLLGGLAFSIGFIALALARSELFTEDFLIPVTTVIARQARLRGLLRLWAGTLAGNLIGGWVFILLVIVGLPRLHAQAIESGTYYVHLGIGLHAFALAIIGGTVITLMTWMQHGTDSVPAKLAAAVTGAFLLAAGQLDHAIVNSLLMFAALQTNHAPFGYLQWAETAGWAALGNIIGGVGLVTLLRIVQVPNVLKAEREHPAPGVPFNEPG